MKLKFVVLTSATDRRDDELNVWYDTVHMPDVLAVNGVVGGSRYRIAGDGDETCPHTFLTIYDWEADSVEEAKASLAAANESGELPLDGLLDIANTKAWFFEPMT